jgi:hypothetical protein
MGLSSDHNSRKGEVKSRTDAINPDCRGVRGSGGLPKWGKELLEDGMIYLFNLAKAQKMSLVFWTITIPTFCVDGSPITPKDHQLILANWSELVKRIFEELAREQTRLGLPAKWLHVVEPQEQRWREHRQFAPHIHAVILNRYQDGWMLSHETTDRIVQRCFSNLLGKPVDVRSACNLAPIHGMSRLAFYLTKLGKIGRYLSKGSRLMGEFREAGVTLPSSWYGSDAETRQIVRAC